MDWSQLRDLLEPIQTGQGSNHLGPMVRERLMPWIPLVPERKFRRMNRTARAALEERAKRYRMSLKKPRSQNSYLWTEGRLVPTILPKDQPATRGEALNWRWRPWLAAVHR